MGSQSLVIAFLPCLYIQESEDRLPRHLLAQELRDGSGHYRLRGVPRQVGHNIISVDLYVTNENIRSGSGAA